MHDDDVPLSKAAPASTQCHASSHLEVFRDLALALLVDVSVTRQKLFETLDFLTQL